MSEWFDAPTGPGMWWRCVGATAPVLCRVSGDAAGLSVERVDGLEVLYLATPCAGVLWRRDASAVLKGIALPWKVRPLMKGRSHPAIVEDGDGDTVTPIHIGHTSMERSDAHVALIVAAVNALPGLLDAAERAERAERERDALRAERDGEHDLIARQAAILTAVANALKGTPPALRTWSHHDLGAVAAATVAQQAPLVACVDALRAAARDAGWRDADATGETLVAWVRRGAMRECLAVARAEQGVPDGARLADFNAVECAARIADCIAKLMGGE